MGCAGLQTSAPHSFFPATRTTTHHACSSTSATMSSNTLELSGELSVGDVIALDIGSQTHLLACDPVGWRPISEPAPTDLSGRPLSAAGVYQHITDQRPNR
jgi:hypothetical protein